MHTGGSVRQQHMQSITRRGLSRARIKSDAPETKYPHAQFTHMRIPQKESSLHTQMHENATSPQAGHTVRGRSTRSLVPQSRILGRYLFELTLVLLLDEKR